MVTLGFAVGQPLTHDCVLIQRARRVLIQRVHSVVHLSFYHPIIPTSPSRDPLLLTQGRAHTRTHTTSETEK